MNVEGESDLNNESIFGKLSKGVVSLAFRQVVVRLTSFFGSILLARLLAPVDFGLYALVGFFGGFLSLISDMGLGAGLLQYKQEPDRRLIFSVFTLIQLIYICLFVIGVPTSLLFKHIYKMSNENELMLLVILVTFYFNSFRTLPVTFLERGLRFSNIALLEMVEGIIYQVGAVVFALSHFGAWSFVLGNFLSRITGVIIANIMFPVRIGFVFKFKDALPLVKLGGVIQAANIAAYIKDSIIPTVIGLTLGVGEVGFINFALKIISYIFMPLELVHRILFPALSRLDHNSHSYTAIVDRVVHLYVIISYGSIGIVGLCIPEIVGIVFSPKWIPAISIIYSFLFLQFGYGLTIPVFTVLASRRKAGLFLGFNIVQMLIMWIVGFPLVRHWGIRGFETTNFIEILTFIPFLLLAKKVVSLSYISHIWRPLVSLVAMYGIITLAQVKGHVHNFPMLLVLLFMAFIVYAGSILSLDRSLRKMILKYFRRHFTIGFVER